MRPFAIIKIYCTYNQSLWKLFEESWASTHFFNASGKVFSGTLCWKLVEAFLRHLHSPFSTFLIRWTKKVGRDKSGQCRGWESFGMLFVSGKCGWTRCRGEAPNRWRFFFAQLTLSLSLLRTFQVKSTVDCYSHWYKLMMDQPFGI